MYIHRSSKGLRRCYSLGQKNSLVGIDFEHKGTRLEALLPLKDISTDPPPPSLSGSLYNLRPRRRNRNRGYPKAEPWLRFVRVCRCVRLKQVLALVGMANEWDT